MACAETDTLARGVSHDVEIGVRAAKPPERHASACVSAVVDFELRVFALLREEGVFVYVQHPRLLIAPQHNQSAKPTRHAPERVIMWPLHFYCPP